ncbi:hypothetical protein [Marinicrinis lubricantis]|uniref:N-acetyltransferase domain-containing protein n=1 Tax=Marinicrinis lubricantis TaxID=2086470 RepID=A0ABW1IU06_9BACL
MAYRAVLVDGDDKAQLYLDFLLDCRHQFTPPSSIKDTCFGAYRALAQGKAVIVQNNQHEVIAAGGFVYDFLESSEGTRKNVWIERVAVRESYLGTRAFFKGLHYLVQILAGEQVDTVSFHAYKQNRYLLALYGKFEGSRINDDTLDTHRIYEVPFGQFMDRVQRIMIKDEKRGSTA